MRQICNSVQLAGRIVAAPSLRQLTDGTYVGNFSLRPFYQPQRGIGEEQQIFELVAWGELAQSIYQRVRKDQSIVIKGRLSTRPFVRENCRCRKTEIHLQEYLVID